MKKKDASFWSDIKALDERLTREPDSFCFARLSEIYLKVGLVADALHAARSGVAKHPGYLAGLRALGMACNASGLHDECRTILERVTAAMPEDVDAQKALASLYVAAGDHASAIRTYNTVLDFRPDDRCSAVELEALQHGDMAASCDVPETGQIDATPVAVDETDSEDEIIELSESDIHEETTEEVCVVTPLVESLAVADHHDPLSTQTLAELYEQQGFLPKALAIYRTILADDPTNAQLIAKVADLERDEPVVDDSLEEDATVDFDEEPDSFEPEAYEEDLPAPLESPFFEPVPENVAEVVEPEFSASVSCEDMTPPVESNTFAPLAHQSADNVLDTLDGWLENIRRIKACR